MAKRVERAWQFEMGIEDIDALCKKLEGIPYYQELFEMRYGTKEVTAEKLSNELAWFVQGIVGTSEFDKGNLTAEQKVGQELFITKYQCNICHRNLADLLAIEPNDDRCAVKLELVL